MQNKLSFWGLDSSLAVGNDTFINCQELDAFNNLGGLQRRRLQNSQLG